MTSVGVVSGQPTFLLTLRRHWAKAKGLPKPRWPSISGITQPATRYEAERSAVCMPSHRIVRDADDRPAKNCGESPLMSPPTRSLNSHDRGSKQRVQISWTHSPGTRQLPTAQEHRTNPPCRPLACGRHLVARTIGWPRFWPSKFKAPRT